MKFVKVIVILTLLLSLATAFAVLKVVPSATSVEEGGVLPIQVFFTDEEGKPKKGLLTADASSGGFDELDIIFDGISFEGSTTVHYIAPYAEGESLITFKADGESTSITVKIYKESVVGKKVRVKVESFGGSAAYKKAGSEVWEPIVEGLELEQGDSILTLKDSFVSLKFPNESVTKVLENTQLVIEKLLEKDGGYIIEIKQLKGKTYNSVQKLLKTGEKFIIKTDSVTAGVRGTKFAVLYEGEHPDIAVFEGKVFTYINDGRAFLVGEGYKMGPELDKPKPHELSEEDFIKYGEELKKEEEEKPKEEEGKEKTKEGKEEMEKGGAGFQIGQPSLSVGPANVGGKNYLMYALSFDFTIGPLWLDLGISAYSDKLDGTLYYGLPSSTPSTNVIDAIAINGIGIVFGKSYIRYSLMPSYDIGMGFTLRGYTVPNARALDTKLDFGNGYIVMHLPYELKKISTFEIAPSDSIWFGELGIKALGMYIYGGGIYDTQEATPQSGQEQINKAIIGGIKKEFLGGYLGVEASLELSNSLMAYGAFGGYHGRYGVLEFIAGIYGGMSGFHPFVFNRNYYNFRLDGAVPGIFADGRMSLGYLAGGELDWTYLKLKLYLNGNLLDNSVAVEGIARGIIPAVGGINGLFITGELYDSTPFDGMFEIGGDTSAWLRISYPIMGESLTAGMIFSWNSSTGDWDKFIVIGSDIWR